MKIVKPSVELLNAPSYESTLKLIEQAGRTCYKSEANMTNDSAEAFVRRLIARGHESVLEHVSLTARFICDRGISHEIVRHRLASYSQESTRYCNYSNGRFGGEITVICPPQLEEGSIELEHWYDACQWAEYHYFKMIDAGCAPQIARSVLPTCLKTEVVMTANLREWRHFFKLRCAAAAHPQMRVLAGIALLQFALEYKVFFEDLKIGD